MDPPYVHAFVAKLWLERREIEGTQPEWRGRIDHVTSGRRIYFRDLSEITAFIHSFLQGALDISGDQENDIETKP
jgi:hypothetical protein